MTLKAPFAGEPISSAQWLQPVARALNRQEEARAVSVQSPAAPANASSSGIESATFIAEQINTVTATRASDGATITIAKPPNLRGNIGTRVNSDGDTEEIFRAYFPGDVLLVAEVLITGVAGVTLADLNWAARRWTIEV